MSGEVDVRGVSMVRPWGLRGLRPAPPAGVPVYRYDPVRQVAVTLGDELWINSKKGKTWSARARRSRVQNRPSVVSRNGSP